MSEWREMMLGDVLLFQRGFDLTRSAATPGPYPVISSGGIGYTCDIGKVPGPGVITGRKGVLGKVYYSAGPYWPHDTTLWVKDFKESDPRFIYYMLQTLPLASLDAGASNPTLNRNHAHLLAVRMPDPTTQRRVSSVLGALDDLIENDRRRIKLLDRMAQAIYREWFVHFRYPNHEALTLVDSSYGPIPDGWCVVPLSTVAVVNRSSRKPSAGEDIRYLDISCLGDRFVGVPARMNGALAPGRARRVVGADDVVWSMVRPNRRAHALLVDPGKDWIASTGLAVITPTRISPSLLFEIVSAREFSDYLVSQESGAAYPAVKPADLEAAAALTPSREIDREFEQVVGPLHQMIWTLRERSAGLGMIRDLLLPKLVTGQIDVSKLDLDALVGAVG